ncbi:hypothetical protein RQP46_001878 [Phenoliferia psychrophenolica]
MLLAALVVVGGTARLATAAAISPRGSIDHRKRATYPAPIALTGDTSGVHDPSLVKTPAGHYILYGSGGWADDNGREVGPGIPTWTSVDRVNWVYAGTAFATIPSDAVRFTGSPTASLWAPDVTYVRNTPTGLPGSWQDGGLVIASNPGDDWNAIDPHLHVAGGADDVWSLVAGSFWSGIQWMPLDHSTGMVSDATLVPLGDRNDPTNGLDNIRVVRSLMVAGPYVDASGLRALEGGGTEILGTHGGIIAPGGQNVITDVDGPLLVYHYISPTTPAPLLGLNLLDFSSGWPVVILPAVVSPAIPTPTVAPVGVPTPLETVATVDAPYLTMGLGPHGAENATAVPLSSAYAYTTSVLGTLPTHEPSSSNNHSSSAPGGAIAGAVIGILALIALTALAVYGQRFGEVAGGAGRRGSGGYGVGAATACEGYLRIQGLG